MSAVYAVTVVVRFDPEAGVFFATSDDIPGLVTEASTFETLRQNVRDLIPDLIELNGLSDDFPLDQVPITLIAQDMMSTRHHA